ncbi:hypothetical protein V6N13_007944 [Hibiscus sabdariffa]
MREPPSLSRLDRFLISPEILSLWPNVVHEILSKSISDHNPIAINYHDIDWGPKPFRWFNHWLEDKKIVDIISNSCKASQGKGIGFTLRACKFATKNCLREKLDRGPTLIRNLEQHCLELDNEIQKRRGWSSKDY